ncbi:DNA primase [Bacillus sp. C1-1]|nr:DNA primase [Bacillus sp. C1-1]
MEFLLLIKADYAFDHYIRSKTSTVNPLITDEEAHLRASLASIENCINYVNLAQACIHCAGDSAIDWFQNILKQECNYSEENAKQLFEKGVAIDTALQFNPLIEEVQRVIKRTRLREAGFVNNIKKNRLDFNANLFVEGFLNAVSVCSTNDGTLYIYNYAGYYEALATHQLGQLIRVFMHERSDNSWQTNREVEIVEALKREATIVPEMNQDRAYLNVQNGMLCLRHYKIHPHDPSFYSTIQIPFSYEPGAGAPKFNGFLSQITLGDENLQRVIQEMFGYALSAETSAEKMFLWYGRGANGKSVLAAILRSLVGKDNVASVTLSDFSSPFGLAPLIGKTVNIATENDMMGKPMKTDMLKGVISGDTLTVNVKYKPAVEMTPIVKLFFVSNELPETRDLTHGFERKLMLIPFMLQLEENERNVNLENDLKQELSGIFMWALEGLKRLKANHYVFSKCAVIEQTHKAYFSEQNPVLSFIDEHLRQVSGHRVKQSDLFLIYQQWLAMQGIDDKGTQSRQIFWKYFKLACEKTKLITDKKKVKGIYYIDNLKVVNFEVDSFLGGIGGI